MGFRPSPISSAHSVHATRGEPPDALPLSRERRPLNSRIAQSHRAARRLQRLVRPLEGRAQCARVSSVARASRVACAQRSPSRHALPEE